jgi:hypothetical protein
MKIPSPVNVSCQYPAEVRGKPLFAWGKPHGGFVLVREDGQQAFPLPIKPAFLKRPQKKKVITIEPQLEWNAVHSIFSSSTPAGFPS